MQRFLPQSRLLICLFLICLPNWLANQAITAQQNSARPELFFGWTMTELDLTVDVQPDLPTMRIYGRLALRLDEESADGITLALNTGKSAAMEWVSLTAPNQDDQVQTNLRVSRFPSARLAIIKLARPARHGTTTEVKFELEWKTYSGQVGIADNIAIASWTDAWYPFPIPRFPEGEEYTSQIASAPGTTTFHLPVGWSALSDGKLKSREKKDDRVTEVRQVSAPAVARSFSAAAYRQAQFEQGNRPASAYLLEERNISAKEFARLFEQIISAQEKAFGEYPFDSIGVAEVPNRIPGWYAASQQTFVMAKSAAFGHGHNNLPLWSHELCHAWWGNTVSTAGDAEKMVGEALAQFGCWLAIESIEGSDQAKQFREFSRSGFSAEQCANGYFRMCRSGKDAPLSELSVCKLDFETTHNLANSKGVWVYHMLRNLVGEDVMFATLKRIAREYADKPLSLQNLRTEFIAAAPKLPVSQFFQQWLDRTGAPVIELKTHSEQDRIQRVELRQIQNGRSLRSDP